MKFQLKSILCLAIPAMLFLLSTGSALASGPARTQTVAAGPYIVDIELSQSPPYVDQPLAVTVVPHDHTLHLQGSITAQPGLGTDAVPLHFPLHAIGGEQGALQGSIHMPVRGAWNIIAELQGPSGAGSGSIAVTVASPGAIPVWLGWMIGCTPLLGIAWWVWYQHQHRQSFMAPRIEKTE